MKVCVHIREPIISNIRKDNLRSEGRLERLMLEAAIANPEITEVYTTDYIWLGATSPKYKGGIRNANIGQYILLTQDWNTSVINMYPFKAAVVSIFAGPWKEQKQEIADTIKKYNNNIFFTIGFPLMYQEEAKGFSSFRHTGYPAPDGTPVSHLESFIDKENILSLPVPGIPESRYTDKFNNDTILWASRIVFMNQMTTSRTLFWSLDKLQQDTRLKLHIITGWADWEVKDYVDNQVFWVKENINDYFWNMKEFKPYESLRDRIQVSYSFDWDQMLEHYNTAKLLASHGKMYGGAPLESSMYGVPFVGMPNIGALGLCSNYLTATSDDEACTLMDKLMTNHEFYSSTAKAHHDYAIETYSFTAFNNNLNKILKERNLL